MSSLTMRQRLIVWYFIVSFCLLFIGDGSPVWVIVAVVANFVNAARLARSIEFKEV